MLNGLLNVYFGKKIVRKQNRLANQCRITCVPCYLGLMKALLFINPIQVNIAGGGPYNNNKGSGMKIYTTTSRFWKLQCGLFCHTTSHLKKKLIERNK